MGQLRILATAATLVFCLALQPVSIPVEAAGSKAVNARCHAMAKKKAERKMGPKAFENAILLGATGGLAGKAVGGKKTFTGFGLAGAAIGIIVANERRAKFRKAYYAACIKRR